jgi:hypothetical protein
MKRRSKKREKTRGARPLTRSDVAKLRRLLEKEERPAWRIKIIKEWAKRKRGLDPKALKAILALDDELPGEIAWAKIEVILDMIETEDEET